MSSLQSLLNPMSSGPPSPVALVGARPRGSSQRFALKSNYEGTIRKPKAELESEPELESEVELDENDEEDDEEEEQEKGPSPITKAEEPEGVTEMVVGMVERVIEEGAETHEERYDKEGSEDEEEPSDDDATIDDIERMPHSLIEEMVDEVINFHDLNPREDDATTITDDEEVQLNGYHYFGEDQFHDETEGTGVDTTTHDTPKSLSPPLTPMEVDPTSSAQIDTNTNLHSEHSPASSSLKKKPVETAVTVEDRSIHDKTNTESHHHHITDKDRISHSVALRAYPPPAKDQQDPNLDDLLLEAAGDGLTHSTPSITSPPPESLPSAKLKAKKKAVAPKKKGVAKTAVKKRKVELESKEDEREQEDEDYEKSRPPSPPSVAVVAKRKPKKKKADFANTNGDYSPNGPKYDESGAVLYCICRKPDTGKWMIGCDGCDEWYHGECINVREEDGDLIDKYYCPHCKSPTQQTTWRRRCRLPTCRQPANVSATPPSKYCSSEHGVEFMQLQIVRSTIPKSELASVVLNINNADEFKILGDRIPTPPPENPGNPYSASPLYHEEISRLLEIARERLSLDNRGKLIDKRCSYLPLAMDRRKRIWDELKADDKTMTNMCGYDERFALDDAEWTEWCETPEAEAVFENGTISGREGVCIKKRCNKHLRWADLFSDEQTIAERQRKERLVQLKLLERKIKERQKRRAVKHESEGRVETEVE